MKLQQELERLTPAHEDLEVAADLLGNFKPRFDACGGDIEAQRELISLIVERVYVHNQLVYAITLKLDYHIVLGHKGDGSSHAVEIAPNVCVWSRRELGTHAYTGKITVKLIPPYRKFTR